MKAFKEVDYEEPRIYVTASPTLALWHAIENGPHDTPRKEGRLDYNSSIDVNPVLLVLRVDKEWLKNQEDANKPLPIPDYIKEAKGITKEKDTRLLGFIEGLRNEVAQLKTGRETSDFGLRFPVNEVPSRFIFVRSPNGQQLVPIKEYASRLLSAKPLKA